MKKDLAILPRSTSQPESPHKASASLDMHPTLSVAMATFNGGAYLAQQLQSIADQTVLPSELVICDDQSSDSTQDIVAAFAGAAPFPVRFEINATRLGYRRNFAKAAGLCAGQLISFSDQDDIWERNKVAETLHFFERSDCLLAAHDFSVFFEGRQGQDIPSYFDFLRQSGLSEVISLKGCTFTMRRKLIERVGWPPEEFRDRWGHDVWLCLTATLLESQGFIDQPLIRHRIHGANTSGALWGGRDRLRRILRRLHCPPFTSRHPLDAFFSYYFLPDGKDVYESAIRQCDPAMTEQQRQRARAAYANRVAFLDFPASAAYASAATRIPRTLSLFFRGIYRDGDGLLGLVQDLYGDRRGRI